jgi:hypothetical protein
LRVYGAHSPKAKHDCKDSRLEVPLQGVNREAIVKALSLVHPTGYTPIAASLEAAAMDFKKDGDRIVVLITDGVESCGGDPCATSDRLQKEGAFQKPYVLGFAVNEEEKERLSCIGTYVDARSGEELQKLLDEVIQKAVVAARLEVSATFNGSLIPAARLQAEVRQGGVSEPIEPGKAVRLPPGDYEVVVSQTLDPKCGSVVEPVKVAEGGVTRVKALFGRGTVKFEAGGVHLGDLLAATDLAIWPAGKLGQDKPMLQGRANQTAKLCTGKYDFRFTHPAKGKAEVTGYEVKPDVTSVIPVRF